MKKDELIAAANKAKIEINDQIDEFIESVDRGTTDPEDFASFTEIENMWHNLSLTTHKTYSDMMNKTLSALDTPEVNAAKKGNSSRME